MVRQHEGLHALLRERALALLGRKPQRPGVDSGDDRTSLRLHEQDVAGELEARLPDVVAGLPVRQIDAEGRPPGRVERVQRSIPYEEANGEFMGVAKFRARGAGMLREHYHRRRREHWDRPYREAQQFQKAYLIHLFQDMIEQGVEFGHADTHGQYREIDTQEDLDLAQREWGR